jgi:hypothetical protein
MHQIQPPLIDSCVTGPRMYFCTRKVVMLQGHHIPHHNSGTPKGGDSCSVASTETMIDQIQ